MYVGRIVAVARTKANQACGLYRVSSRSFPNRMATQVEKGIAIVPKPGHESDIFKNPYIAYNCLRQAGRYAVVSNGSHTDPVTEKLQKGMSMRDALITALNGMDYEHDQLNTPRIAGIVDLESNRAALGIIRHDALFVKCLELAPGEAFYIATYEHNCPKPDYRDGDFDVASAAGACDYVLGQGVFKALERPVSAACVLQGPHGWEVAIKDQPQ